MREIWFGDTTINKNMKSLVKTFYNILFNCEKYKEMSTDEKIMFFNEYLELNNVNNTAITEDIIEYFDKYEAFCFDLNPNSVLKGELMFNYKWIFAMAVPKRKTSKSRRNQRRSHHRISSINIIEDKKSGEFRLSHHVDLKTGLYNGKQIIEPKK